MTVEGAGRGNRNAADASATVHTCVVCGDSLSSEWGLASGVPAYPELLGDLLAEGGDAVELDVRISRGLHGTVRDVDLISAKQPSVVILAHGAREAVLRLPRHMRRLPASPIATDEEAARPALVRLLSSLRRFTWYGLIRTLALPQWYWLGRALGLRPGMTPLEFDNALGNVVKQLVDHTGATVVLAMSGLHRVTVFPLSYPTALAGRATAVQIAAQHPGRVIAVDLNGVLTDPDDFAWDGSHYSAGGHRKAAEAIMAAVAAARLSLHESTSMAGSFRDIQACERQVNCPPICETVPSDLLMLRGAEKWRPLVASRLGNLGRRRP